MSFRKKSKNPNKANIYVYASSKMSSDSSATGASIKYNINASTYTLLFLGSFPHCSPMAFLSIALSTKVISKVRKSNNDSLPCDNGCYIASGIYSDFSISKPSITDLTPVKLFRLKANVNNQRNRKPSQKLLLAFPYHLLPQYIFPALVVYISLINRFM